MERTQKPGIVIPIVIQLPGHPVNQVSLAYNGYTSPLFSFISGVLFFIRKVNLGYYSDTLDIYDVGSLWHNPWLADVCCLRCVRCVLLYIRCMLLLQQARAHCTRTDVHSEVMMIVSNSPSPINKQNHPPLILSTLLLSVESKNIDICIYIYIYHV